MKVIIAGSRSINPAPERMNSIMQEVTQWWGPVKIVVCGGARGVDAAGKRWAQENRLPVRMFIPKWDVHGKSAGYLRNKEMARFADALVLIWDGESKGSANMKHEAERRGLHVLEILEV